MKAAVLALLMVDVALGAACFHLFQLLEPERSQLRYGVARAQQPAGNLHTQASMPAPEGTGSMPVSQESPSPRDGRDDGRLEVIAQLREEFDNDPVIQQIQRAVREHSMQSEYGELIRRLKLPETVAARFIGLQIEQDTRIGEVVQREYEPDALAAAKAAVQAEYDASIVSLLGIAHYWEYEKHLATRAERGEISTLNHRMAPLDGPLSEDQRDRMLAAMLEEKKPTSAPGGTSGQKDKAYWRRIRERFSGILTAEQLREYDELRLEQARATAIRDGTPVELP